MIDLAAVRTLDAVREHGSVVAAAAALGYTPSAVSQQIKRLERHTGVQLLERVGRGVALTELGRRLADDGNRVLGDLEAIEAQLAAAHGSAPLHGQVRIAAFSTGVRGLVAPALATLRDSDPGLDVRVVESDPHEALDLVAGGQVDTALVHNWGDLPLPIPAHVEDVHLGIDTADVLVPRDHPLATRSVITAADLDGLVWTCAPVGSVCHGWLVHLHDAHGLRPDVRYWAMEFSSQIGLVEHGNAVALVPRLGRESLPSGVIAVPVDDPVTRRILQVWRRTTAPSPAIRRVHDVLTSAMDAVAVAHPR